jgi:toxin ParE1/3/4
VEIVITNQALTSLNDSLIFLNVTQSITFEKALEIRGQIFARIESLKLNPYLGQTESFMSKSKEYRRLIEGSYKIIYYIEKNSVYVTDIFDSRQNPSRMKG